MKRRWLTAGIVLLWAATTAWLVFCEAYPGLFTRTSAGYRSLLSEGLLVMDRWMKVSFKDTPIGYSHTRIETHEENALKRCVIHNEMVLNLTIMGQTERVKVTAQATLDAMYHLCDFFFILASRGYSLGVQGVRSHHEVFDVTIRSAGSSEHMEVTIPDDAVVHSPMMEVTVRQLTPGRQTTMRVFNPLSLTADEMVLKALRREPLRLNGETREVTVLSAEYQGMRVLSWVDETGEILRQESPFGWSLELCSAREALALDRAADGVPDDILAATAVVADGTVSEPRSRDRLRVRLRGRGFRKEDLASHRQEVGRILEDSVELTLRPDVLPAPTGCRGEIPPEARAFLCASPFIQSDSEAIRKLAARIAGREKGDLAVARALHKWVHGNIRKQPRVSVPSALDVLKNLEGDCNEHTTLFVALARAAGLPAKIIVGVVYNKGAFYYHAWPAVYVGQWLEMDPTLGQEAVDATHIRLLEGELRDQFRLMRLVGRLRVEILGND